MRLTAVVIARNEAAAIGATLRRLVAPDVEIIVVDGHSTDDSVRRALPFARVIRAEAGRARQLRAGVAAARPASDTLLFVHADTLLPVNYTSAIAACLADPRAVGGAFRRWFDAPNLSLRLLAAVDNLRARLTRIYLGDQCIFVRRAVYDRIGGFPPEDLFEDVAFSRRLRAAGHTCLMPRGVRTSARRFLARGPGRTFARMLTLWLLYWLGAPPAWLARRYGPGR